MLFRTIAGITFLGILTLPAFADKRATSDICDQVALRAAADAHIPQNVMLAVTRLETGRAINGKQRPWPWTANVAGDGHWFDSADALREFLFRQIKEGRQNFDVGCFQINYRWHGHAFESLAQMADPQINATYAAQFLRELHAEMGDWTAAVGAYHSRTPGHAQRYTRKYKQVSQTLPQIAAADPRNSMPANVVAPMPNRFSLLRSGGQGAGRGSLVPLDAPVTPLVSQP